MSSDPVMDKILIIWIALMAISWILYAIFLEIGYLLVAFLITLIGVLSVGAIRSYREKNM